MFLLLRLITLLFLLISCGKEGDQQKTLVRFSYPKISGMMAADGGVYIFGRHLQLKETFSTFLTSAADKKEYEQLLASGDWNFRALYFADGNPGNGSPTYCGQIIAQLKGGTHDFDIAVSKAGCDNQVFAGETGFGGAFYGTTQELKPLRIYFCNVANFDSGTHSSCTVDMSTYSYKVVYPRSPVHGIELDRNTIQKIKNLTATDFLHNGCQTGPAGGNALYNVKTPVPLVNSLELYGLLSVFNNTTCTGVPYRIYPIVFDYPIQFRIKRKLLASNEMSVLVDVVTQLY